MEKLLAGEDGTRERRKSIKTYREIVQEKCIFGKKHTEGESLYILVLRKKEHNCILKIMTVGMHFYFF